MVPGARRCRLPFRPLLLIAGLAVLLVPLTATSAAAQSATSPPTIRSLTTPYPGLTVQAGSSVQVDLTVTSPTVAAVRLDVAAPTGWRTTLRGAGFVITGLTATPDKPGTARLEIDVPADSPAGDHDVKVTAHFADGDEVLTMTLRVQESVDSGVEVTADFPSLQGGPTDTFTYTVTVRNNTPIEQTFTFSASGPSGWSVDASPTAETRANTLSIAAGGTGSIKVTATPADTTAAGTYGIDLTVAAENGASATGTFQAEVTGTPKLELSTVDGTLNANGQAGKTTKATLLVTNSGSAPLENVRLTATPPKNWDVTFEPATLEAVLPGETAQVVASIDPPSDAVAGDYALGIRAGAGTQTSSVALRFALETSSWVGLVAALVIVIALGVLGLVYRRFGRR